MGDSKLTTHKRGEPDAYFDTNSEAAKLAAQAPAMARLMQRIDKRRSTSRRSIFLDALFGICH